MIARKVATAIAAIAVIGGLGGGAIALANNGDEPSQATSTATSGVNDDGTADQGHGDAPGTAGFHDGDDDRSDDGDGGDHGDRGSGDNSGPGGGDDSSGPGGTSGQG